ncbi:hypothetical protein Ae201684P_019840 [Aphanomyces euteiches]|uniref:F-box domain-containing protein n=1 Tax=Aphanomyces euteiches TaxID=100861 RepID=A0A6G0XEH2_9STRA|nr:hypothetical protein Ae201684_005565 [Aphanomyces euteiches]KAH9078766.1 hypothetical protein Ae201684P_019840 [Aphanomyces euteiches]KAH9140467.1 hypothetical protein AeRB84_015311 [Aphanomyces euteiches]
MMQKAGEPLKKKAKRPTDLLKCPPTLDNPIYLGNLPQPIFLSTIGSWTFGMLDIRDLLSLSMVSRSFYYTMDHPYWEKIVENPMFDGMKTVGVYVKSLPHQRSVRIMDKRMCRHCRRCQPKNIVPLWPVFEKFKVCWQCAKLPSIAEVQHTEAVHKYGLKRKQLDTIPSRKQTVNRGYQRLYLLQDILKLVEESKQ